MLKRWYRYRRILGILAVGSIGLIGLGAVDENKPVEEIYIVQPGDTLWSVASKNITDEENILAYMNEMKKPIHISKQICRLAKSY